MPSPAFHFASQASLLKFSATAAGSVVATLDSLSGVTSVEWTVIGVDDSDTLATRQATIVTNGTLGSVCTLTAGAAGTAGLLRCRINAGIGAQTGQPDATYSTTAKFYVPAASSNLEVLASGEQMESSSLSGWAGPLNAAIRTSGIGSSVSLDALSANVLAAAVALASNGDATQTILLSAGRKRTATALTANRAITLSNTGAVEGDTITIARTTTAYFKLRINNAAGTQIFVMARPGTFTAQFRGGAWVRYQSDVGHGVRTISPYEFGAIGDGVADDTVAIQAMFDALSGLGSSGFNGQFIIPHGTYLISSPITFAGDYYKSYRITGDTGGSLAFQGVCFVWGGAAGATMFHCAAMNGCTFEHLEFKCMNLAKYAVVLTYTYDDGIDLGSGAGSQNCIFYRCSFYFPQDAAGAACVALGPMGIIARQTSEISFNECNFLGDPNDSTYLGVGIRTRINGNTKNFRVTNCNFLGFAYAIDWDNASGIFNINGCTFGYCYVSDVRASGGVMTMIGCESEGSGMIASGTSGGGVGSLTIIGHDWNGLEVIDDFICDYRGTLTIQNSTFVNGRFQALVTGSAAANTLTAVAHGFENGEKFWIYNVDGTMPAPLMKRVYYYVVEKTADTFKASLTLGGAAIDLTTNGSGTIWAYSPCIVKLSGCQTAESSTTGASFISEGNFFMGASEFADFRDSSNNLLIEGEYPPSNPQCISSRNDYGGFGGDIVRLLNIESNAPMVGSIQTYAASLGTLSKRVILGATNDGWHSWEIGLEHFALTAGTTHQIAVFLPPRTFLTRLIIDTQTAVVGPATATAKAYAVLPGPPADMILVHDIKATGRKGLLEAERGALLNDAAVGVIRDGYMPTAGWGSQWFFYVDLVAASAWSGASAGRIRVLMRTERAP